VYHLAVVDTPLTPLQADLVAMLESMRRAERALFAEVPPDGREQPGAIGEWSVKDVRAHLAAWRSIEARRLGARAAADVAEPMDDPGPDVPIDDANATLHDRYAGLSWDAVAAEADASVDALIGAIRRSSTDVLCECDEGSVAGIGANGVTHAVGHLPEIAELADGEAHFVVFAREIETILGAGHLPPRDSGVILYNIACARALSGDLDHARRLLPQAFARRHELRELAPRDPDLVALHDEMASLA
jgi:hypothetical protein